MDKQTLSNYGWIVIAVLVLAVMIALATPFGTYIENGVKSTTQGLFDTSEKAMNVVGMSAVTPPEIIEGAGQTYSSITATTALSFRSNADYSTFKEVKVDGETVDSENYTVTEGSTIITFTDEYAETLSRGNHTIDVVSSVGTATCDFTSANPFTTLTEKNRNSIPASCGLYGENIWTDGLNTYLSFGGTEQYILNGDTWEPKTWNYGYGLSGISGSCVWTDGINIYCSYGSGNEYVLNGDTWKQCFTGIKEFGNYFEADYIWTDGTNTYYSHYADQYILNNGTWEKTTWNIYNLDGDDVWTDGTNTYYSNNEYGSSVMCHYILNGDTWSRITWNGLKKFYGHNVWTDGTNTYYSASTEQYILKGDTWKPKAWNIDTKYFYGKAVWVDGTNYYHSHFSNDALKDINYIIS